MRPVETWWAIKLDNPETKGTVFYYKPTVTGPMLFDSERSAIRFLAHMRSILKGKVVEVTIGAAE